MTASRIGVRLGVALYLALFFAYLLGPLVIMFTVPLATTGAVLAMWINSKFGPEGTLNVYSQIGLVMLVGLITKNGILIVEFANQLRRKGIRVEIDDSDDRFPKKIRNASKSKVPFVLIAGEEDRSHRAVSFRYRDGSQKNGVPVEQAIAEIVEAVESRRQV